MKDVIIKIYDEDGNVLAEHCLKDCVQDIADSGHCDSESEMFQEGLSELMAAVALDVNQLSRGEAR